MFTDPFTKCTPQEIDVLLKILDQQKPNHGFHVPGLMALKKSLDFYEGAFFYELTQADHHPAKNIALVANKQSVLLCDGMAQTIESYNKNAPIKLDQTKVMDYVRFYFAHVVGPHGITTIVDTVDDLLLVEEPTPGLRKALSDKITPMALNAALSDGTYQLRATLLVAKTLYGVLIDVDSQGKIDVQRTRVLAEILPVVNRALES